jgi:hypothetical protein
MPRLQALELSHRTLPVRVLRDAWRTRAPGPKFKDWRGPGFRVRNSRYYSTYLREVERVGLGYGTKLSGYTSLDPTEDKCASLKPVPRRSDPFLF